MSFKYSDKQIKTKFDKQNINIAIKRSQYRLKPIRYIESTSLDQDSLAPVLLLIHGSPGSGLDFSNILMDQELRSMMRIISVDRIGYGGSSYGKPEHSIERQADMIKEILDQYHFQNIVVLGWSYGGAIAPLLGTKLENKISGGIMIGPAIAPMREKYTILARIAYSIPIRWIVSGAIKVASYEKIHHQNELKKIAFIWQKINYPIIHFHGDNDKIVPYKQNVQYSKKMIPEERLTSITISGGSHFIHIDQYDKVKKEILRLLSIQKE